VASKHTLEMDVSFQAPRAVGSAATRDSDHRKAHWQHILQRSRQVGNRPCRLPGPAAQATVGCERTALFAPMVGASENAASCEEKPRRGSAAIRCKTEAPTRHCASELFCINIGDSDDEDEAVTAQTHASDPRPVPFRGQSWDIEDLFDFDVDTLVGLARATAWGSSTGGPSAELAAHGETEEVARVATQHRYSASENHAGDLAEIHGLRLELEVKDREIELKDRQIERLRRVVCELLCSSEPHTIPGKFPHPTSPVSAQKNGELRACAPEFVPLGIPLLEQINVKELAQRARSVAVPAASRRRRSQRRCHRQELAQKSSRDTPRCLPQRREIEEAVASSTKACPSSTAVLFLWPC